MKYYKYRDAIDEEGNLLEFTSSIFSNFELWFSTVQSLNDPFEVDPTLKEFSKEEFNGYLRRLFGHNIPKEFIDVSLDYMMSLPVEERESSLKDTLKEAIDRVGMCCFSLRCDNILMWTHYGQNHEGLCLGFDSNIDNVLFSNAHPVKYSQDRFEIDINKFGIESTHNILTTKGEMWSHEEEVRILNYRQGGSPNKFKKNALVEVIFGCRMSPSIEKSYRELIIRTGFDNLKFKRIAKSRSKYKFEVIDII